MRLSIRICTYTCTCATTSVYTAAGGVVVVGVIGVAFGPCADVARGFGGGFVGAGAGAFGADTGGGGAADGVRVVGGVVVGEFGVEVGPCADVV
ncbi:hypothetical protein AGMMS50222_09400 [Endomicrobiia bacterium]|nr:hypothetical protein AGMMS49556_08770 [Endomicrobiia bacterium]GHT76595.1 hypothetical protein AGMMS50222_09400 [Endomicrobiia bacterium]